MTISVQETSCPFGFSLLEVVLALAILAGALAALGEVMRLGRPECRGRADESQAEMLAESVMSELLVGARPLAARQRCGARRRRRSALGVSIAVEPTEYQGAGGGPRARVEQQLAPRAAAGPLRSRPLVAESRLLARRNSNSRRTQVDSSSLGSGPSSGRQRHMATSGGQP